MSRTPPTLDLDDLLVAAPENVRRLARAVGLDPEGKEHKKLCRELFRWYKTHPQPNVKKR